MTAGVTTYDYNTLNQLTATADPAGVYTYDDDGNLVSGYTPDGYPFTATYDANERLSSIEYHDGVILHRYEFVYGHDGFLGQIKRFEDTVLTDDLRIVRDGFLAIQERDASNTVIREYVWGLNKGGGIGGLVTMRQGGQDYDYLYDGKGNVSAIIDSTQVVMASYRYDSFGRLRIKTGTLDQPYQFSTKRYLANAGLNYYGYRYYNAAIGRWMSRDPLGELGGINLYGFVENNPVNLIDPEGLWVPQAIGAAVGLGFEGYRQYQSGNLDVGRLAIAAASGALGGFGSSLGRAMLFGATANMLNTAYQQADDPCRQSMDMGQIIRSALYGAGGGSIGYAGGVLGRSIYRPTNIVGQTIGRMPASHYGASGTAIGAATGGFIANQ